MHLIAGVADLDAAVGVDHFDPELIAFQGQVPLMGRGAGERDGRAKDERAHLALKLDRVGIRADSRLDRAGDLVCERLFAAVSPGHTSLRAARRDRQCEQHDGQDEAGQRQLVGQAQERGPARRRGAGGRSRGGAGHGGHERVRG